MSISSPVHIIKHFHRRKLEKLQKKRKNTIKALFLTRCHGNNLQKINNNKYNCENVTNLAGEFREHKSQGKKLGFL